MSTEQDQGFHKREAIKQQIRASLDEHKKRQAVGHLLRNVLEDPANAELAKYRLTSPIVAAVLNSGGTIEELALQLLKTNERLLSDLLKAKQLEEVPRIIYATKEGLQCHNPMNQ